jgi:hypothetical protein
MKNIEKLNELFEDGLTSDLMEVLITRDKQGKYSLFGKYTIIPIDDKGFIAFTPKHLEEYEFSTLVNAASWCTLHNAGRFKEAGRIVLLDLKLSSIKSDIENHIRLLKISKNQSTKFLYVVKLEEDLLRKNIMSEEINYHINSSKRIQEQKFHKSNRQKFKYL